MSTPKRIGIIGTGGMAATMVRALNSSDWFDPVVVLSGTPTRAADFARHLGLEGAETDSASFFGAHRLDAVYVANKNADHAEAVHKAIDAGLPVLVEKPLTAEKADTETLFAHAAEKSVPVMENFWVLALPAYRALKKALAQTTGPKALQFDFSMPVTRDQMPGLFDPAGGGVVLDRAVYGLAYACDLLGPVAKMQAHVRRDSDGVDLGVILVLQHDSGDTSTLTAALDHAGPNVLTVAAGAQAFHLSPALGAETLWQTTHHTSAPADPPWAPAGQMAALKQRPALRRAKSLLSRRGAQFHSYGKNMYHPVLKAFFDMVPHASPPTLVPPALSLSVAALTDEARQA